MKNKPAADRTVSGLGGSKMSVAILGSLIIWLIIAVIVIAIVVYFVNWLPPFVEGALLRAHGPVR